MDKILASFAICCPCIQYYMRLNPDEEPLIPPLPYSFEAQQLCEAATRGDFEDVQRLVLECTTISINEKDEAGYTALFRAVEADHYKIASLLLDLGAAATEANLEGYTPLHAAAKNNNGLMCQLLVSHGADVNALTKTKLSPLHIAVQNNNFDAAKRLVEAGADVNANARLKENCDVPTPFILACKLGYRKIAELLRRNGAYTELSDELGMTALMLASENGHLSTVQYLLTIGCKADVATEKEKWTALHLACSAGHYEIAKCLIEAKCNVNARDFVGRTPLHHASAKGHPTLVSLLIENGADVDAADDGDEFGAKSKKPIDLASESIQYHRVVRAFKEAKLGPNQQRYRQQKRIQFANETARSNSTMGYYENASSRNNNNNENLVNAAHNYYRARTVFATNNYNTTTNNNTTSMPVPPTTNIFRDEKGPKSIRVDRSLLLPNSPIPANSNNNNNNNSNNNSDIALTITITEDVSDAPLHPTPAIRIPARSTRRSKSNKGKKLSDSHVPIAVNEDILTQHKLKLEQILEDDTESEGHSPTGKQIQTNNNNNNTGNGRKGSRRKTSNSSNSSNDVEATSSKTGSSKSSKKDKTVPAPEADKVVSDASASASAVSEALRKADSELLADSEGDDADGQRDYVLGYGYGSLGSDSTISLLPQSTADTTVAAAADELSVSVVTTGSGFTSELFYSTFSNPPAQEVEGGSSASLSAGGGLDPTKQQQQQ